MESHNILSDEELLLLTREGDMKAYTLLVRRFCGPSRIGDIHRAAPTVLSKYSLWEVSSVLLSTFWSCVDGYRFGTVRFHTYYITALRYNLLRFQQSKEKEQIRFASLDALMPGEAEYSLHDILSTEEEKSDPKLFLNYYETLDQLNRLPAQLKPLTIKIVKMKLAGMSFAEIASITKLTYRQVYSRYSRFMKRANKILHNGSSNGESDNDLTED